MHSLKRLFCTGAALLSASAASALAQDIAVFTFNNEAGCATGTTFLDPNVIGAEVCRGPGIAWNTAGGSYNSRDWTIGAGDPVGEDDYVSVVLNVGDGFDANITHLFANLQRSGTGPLNVFVRSSVDGFATTLATGTVSAATTLVPVTFDIPDIIGAAGIVEFRFYANGGTAAGGTLRFQGSGSGPGLAIHGTVQPGGGGDPRGACCIAAAPYCSYVTQEVCDTLGGTYQGDGVTCDIADCPIPVGGCCIDGFCGPGYTLAQCAQANGTWFEGLACDAVVCPQPFGACCVPDQECFVIDCGACISLGGTWAGFGVACESVSCNPDYGDAFIALFDFDANIAGVGNNLSFDYLPGGPEIFPDRPFTSPADGYGMLQRGVTPSNPPFTLLDDTFSIFTADQIGIVNESKLDIWFGIADLNNPDNPSGLGTAEWAFNIAGRTNLSASIDLAAMGNFQAGIDEFDFFASIDGGTPQLVFSLRCDVGGSQMYTLASGSVFTLSNPLMVNGTARLSNVFRTFTASIAGTGSVLTLSMACTSDGDNKGVAFDNIVILGDVGGPTTGACCLIDGACTVETETACLKLGGSFLGNGSPCGKAACDAVSVACCIDSTCQVLPFGACLFQGGTVDSFSASCDGADCGPAFCDADWCRDGVVGVPDIFCFLSAWFAMDPDARCYGGTCDVPAIFAFLSTWFAAGQGPCVP